MTAFFIFGWTYPLRFDRLPGPNWAKNESAIRKPDNYSAWMSENISQLALTFSEPRRPSTFNRNRCERGGWTVMSHSAASARSTMAHTHQTQLQFFITSLHIGAYLRTDLCGWHGYVMPVLCFSVQLSHRGDHAVFCVDGEELLDICVPRDHVPTRRVNTPGYYYIAITR